MNKKTILSLTIAFLLTGCAVKVDNPKETNSLKITSSMMDVESIELAKSSLAGYLKESSSISAEFIEFPFVAPHGRVVLASEQNDLQEANSFKQSYDNDFISVRYMYLVNPDGLDFFSISKSGSFASLESSLAVNLSPYLNLPSFNVPFYVVEIIDNRDSTNNNLILQNAYTFKIIGKLQ